MGVISADEPPLVEASARQVLWYVKGEHVHLKGLRFRYAANMAQQGAARFEGDHGVIEDCTFELTNSSGELFAAGLIVRRCVFRGTTAACWLRRPRARPGGLRERGGTRYQRRGFVSWRPAATTAGTPSPKRLASKGPIVTTRNGPGSTSAT